MKKTIVFLVVFVLICGSAFAMGGKGTKLNKCQAAQWSCGPTAFSECCQQYKYFDENAYNPYGSGVWTCNPNTSEFKACQSQKTAACLKAQGC